MQLCALRGAARARPLAGAVQGLAGADAGGAAAAGELADHRRSAALRIRGAVRPARTSSGSTPIRTARAHTPLRALIFASKYLLELDVALLESPLPAVGVIVAGLLLLRRPSRWDRLLIALVVAQLVGYALYWHEGEFRGPRFLFTALPAFVLLVARAPLRRRGRDAGYRAARRAARAPRRAARRLDRLGRGRRVRSDDIGLYRNASPMARLDPAKIERDAHLRNALVFVSESWESLALRRMWALHVERGDAMRLLDVGPSLCGATGDRGRGTSRAPRSRGGWRAWSGRSRRTTTSPTPSPACLADLTSDADGPATYAPFFPSNTIGADGRIGGNVVYVLDLGTHDEVLRSRFGDRTWYRFGPHLRRGDPNPTLTPYVFTTP